MEELFPDSLSMLTQENNAMITGGFPEEAMRAFINRGGDEYLDDENSYLEDVVPEKNTASHSDRPEQIVLERSKAYRIAEMLVQHVKIFSNEMDKLFIYDEQTGMYKPYNLKKFRSFLTTAFQSIGRGLSDYLCREVFNALQSFPGVPIPEDDACFWNADEHLICCANGVVDLSGEQPRLISHSPEYHFDYCVKAEYITEEKLTHPAWDAYISSSLEQNLEKELLLRQMIGYILSDLSCAKKLLVFLGKVNCGKSVIENFIRALLPRSSTMSLDINDLDNEFKRVSLIGKKVCICHDMKNRRIKTSSEVKSITGGDFIQVAFKGQDVFDVLIRSKLLVSANDFPELGEDDPEKSFASRLAVLLFNVSIPPDKQDRNLGNKLWNERNAIFSDCVRALGIFLHDNQCFALPQESLAFCDELKRPSPEESFINENVEFTGSEKDYLHLQTLEEAFSQYCEATGVACEFSMMKKLLRRRFGKYYGRINRDGKNQWGYSSIRLVDEKTSDPDTYYSNEEDISND